MQNDNDNHNEEVDDNDGRSFTGQLSIIRNNAPSRFFFHNTSTSQRWTTAETKQIVEALENNKTVEELYMDLPFCTFSSIPFFFPYLRSNPRLEKVTIDYNPWHERVVDTIDSVPFQEEYHRQIDGILLGILQNPAIKHLTTNQLGNTPQTIFRSLAETKTLTAFHFESKFMSNRLPISQELALAVAGGMAMNTSLKTVTLEALAEDPLHTMMSGIGGSASSIESISISVESPSTEFGFAISRVLHVTPSLRTLDISVRDGVSHDVWMDQVLYSLRQPLCAQLEKLVLRGSVHLDLERSAMSIAHAVSIKNCIHSVKVLHLYAVVFGDEKSLCMLFNFVELKELEVSMPKFQRPAENNKKYTDYWAELIRRNPKLEKVCIHIPAPDSSGSMGIVNGACGHESLQTLEIKYVVGWAHGRLGASVGAQLCQLLQTTPGLQTLSLERFNIKREGAELLAGSICTNGHLEQFCLRHCEIQLTDLTLILDSVLGNRVLKTFDLGGHVRDRSPTDTRSLCQTLSRVFQGNTTLVNFVLPRMRIRPADMDVLIGGLYHNTTIKSIDCTVTLFQDNDDACMDILINALLPVGSNALSLSAIQLPIIAAIDPVENFLRCLPRMPNIKEVSMKDVLCDRFKSLLLEAAKEKRNLISFSRPHDAIYGAEPIDSEIDFYLNLNRYGRQAVESPNVSTSHWPLILSRIAKEPKDVAALSYFVREYFSKTSITTAPSATTTTTTTEGGGEREEHLGKRAAQPVDVERALSSKRTRGQH